MLKAWRALVARSGSAPAREQKETRLVAVEGLRVAAAQPAHNQVAAPAAAFAAAAFAAAAFVVAASAAFEHRNNRRLFAAVSKAGEIREIRHLADCHSPALGLADTAEKQAAVGMAVVEVEIFQFAAGRAAM